MRTIEATEWGGGDYFGCVGAMRRFYQPRILNIGNSMSGTNTPMSFVIHRTGVCSPVVEGEGGVGGGGGGVGVG